MMHDFKKKIRLAGVTGENLRPRQISGKLIEAMDVPRRNFLT